ncbi:hypothetical protein FKW77_006027 [Venturia effusa]|uniref:Uncharacterized protein n=1 Tax=Venturia effusa TaxID=50376 RepID=A0A517L9F1_9PEZI|nr:hypothetical protein FKW77_006027 [Venturia effusa]
MNRNEPMQTRSMKMTAKAKATAIAISEKPAKTDTVSGHAGKPTTAGRPDGQILYGVAHGRVAKLRGIFGTAGGFLRTQAPGPVTSMDRLSRSGGRVTKVSTARSPTSASTRLRSETRNYQAIAQRPARTARTTAVSLSAHTKVVNRSGDESDIEDRRINAWRSREYDPDAYVAEKNEVPAKIDYPVPIMRCWNCCRCFLLAPLTEEDGPWCCYARGEPRRYYYAPGVADIELEKEDTTYQGRDTEEEGDEGAIPRQDGAESDAEPD